MAYDHEPHAGASDKRLQERALCDIYGQVLTPGSRDLLFMMAGVGALAGVGLGIIRFLDGPHWIDALHGCAHALVFISASFALRCDRAYTLVIATLALALPLICLFTHLLTCFMAGPLICTWLWGYAVGWFFDDRAGYRAFIAIGFLTNAIYLLGALVIDRVFGLGRDTAMSTLAAVSIWHVGSAIMIVVMTFRQSGRNEEARGWPCESCGYAMRGLPRFSSCPECGTKERSLG